MIEITKLSKHYQTDSPLIAGLEEISFSMKKGQILGIIGRSGAGKSTLLRCVNLLEQPSSGNIVINGTNITKLTGNTLRAERRKIGMIFQHFNLLSSKTVFENIALSLKLTKTPKTEIETKVNALLALTGLADKADVYPRDLSGGQKQRVAIARALANEPDVLLCDEATSALDPETTQNVLNLLADINQKLNLTILLVTHEMDVIKTICNQVIVLEQGKIIEQGDALNIFTAPQHGVTKRLVRSTMHTELPKSLSEKLSSTPAENLHPILQITYIGQQAAQPFLSNLGKKFDINFNVLQAHIELVNHKSVGIMVLEALCQPNELESILAFAKQQQIQIEVLGYVQ